MARDAHHDGGDARPRGPHRGGDHRPGHEEKGVEAAQDGEGAEELEGGAEGEPRADLGE